MICIKSLSVKLEKLSTQIKKTVCPSALYRKLFLPIVLNLAWFLLTKYNNVNRVQVGLYFFIKVGHAVILLDFVSFN